MSTQVSAARRDRAAQALADLAATLADHQVLSVQCEHGHHVAAVYATEQGLVFRSTTGPHAHGRMDRPDVAHHGHVHGTAFVELLDDPMAPEMLPASCDCGAWSLVAADLLADVRAGVRTTRAG